MSYGLYGISGDFSSPDWPLFLRDLERAVADGRVYPNGNWAERSLARERVQQERQAEREAFLRSEQARVDAEKAKPRRFGWLFG